MRIASRFPRPSYAVLLVLVMELAILAPGPGFRGGGRASAAEKREGKRDLRRDPRHADEPPSIEDMVQLRDQAKWPQLSAKLEQIPTTLRNDVWKKILNETALALTADADKPEANAKAYFESDDLLIRYPDLDQNSEFMRRRREAGLKFFETCYQNKNNAGVCTQRLRNFASVDPGDLDLQFGTGKLIRQHVGPLDAIPYFEHAIFQGGQTSGCKDSDVKLATTAGLSLAPGRQGENADLIKQSLHVAFNVCWVEWSEILMELYAKDKVHYQHNVCNQLRARGVLTAAQIRACPRIKPEKGAR